MVLDSFMQEHVFKHGVTSSMLQGAVWRFNCVIVSVLGKWTKAKMTC